MGYPIVPKYKDKGELVGFELKGISEDLLKRCSQRRAQIDAAIEKFTETHGRQPTIDEVSQLTLLTRNRKMLEKNNDQVQNYKLSLITDEEKAQIEEIVSVAKFKSGYCHKYYDTDKHSAALQSVGGL